ncbi:hypothetical protein AB1Y20_002670 [Prymnesium parvum]|uniref:Uncharacterized protein n=1 Tax=Prymnesium parvum TaxID=97485 RepID=A0AB34J9T8_PRYPA
MALREESEYADTQSESSGCFEHEAEGDDIEENEDDDDESVGETEAAEQKSCESAEAGSLNQMGPTPLPEAWPELVHRELSELHAALKQQHCELAARELVVRRRESELHRDTQLVRDAIAKEASRLYEQLAATLDRKALAHHQRLEGAIHILRQQCAQLQQTRRAALGVTLPNVLHQPPRKLQAEAGEKKRGAAPATIQQLQFARVQLRETRERLSRSYDLSVALIERIEILSLAPSSRAGEWQRHALPATEALLAGFAAGKDPSHHHVDMLLRLLWAASEARGEPSRPLAQWERKLLRAIGQTPLCHGEGPLRALLLVRLGLRARRASGAVGSAGVSEMARALGLLRALVSQRGKEKEDMLRLGALTELVPLVNVPHTSVCNPAAALLLTLAAVDAHIDALADEAFFLAAARALKGCLASEANDTLASCLCVLLQKLSLRPAARSLYEIDDLRGTLLRLTHSGASDFVLANAKSTLSNIAQIDSQRVEQNM